MSLIITAASITPEMRERINHFWGRVPRQCHVCGAFNWSVEDNLAQLNVLTGVPRFGGTCRISACRYHVPGVRQYRLVERAQVGLEAWCPMSATPTTPPSEALPYTHTDSIVLPQSATEQRFAIRRMDWERLKRCVTRCKQDHSLDYSGWYFLCFGISGSSFLAFVSLFFSTGVPTWIISSFGVLFLGSPYPRNCNVNESGFRRRVFPPRSSG